MSSISAVPLHRLVTADSRVEMARFQRQEKFWNTAKKIALVAIAAICAVVFFFSLLAEIPAAAIRWILLGLVLSTSLLAKIVSETQDKAKESRQKALEEQEILTKFGAIQHWEVSQIEKFLQEKHILLPQVQAQLLLPLIARFLVKEERVQGLVKEVNQMNAFPHPAALFYIRALQKEATLVALDAAFILLILAHPTLQMEREDLPPLASRDLNNLNPQLLRDQLLQSILK